VPLDDVPVGDETANKEIRRWGSPRDIASSREHFELGEAMGLMDFEAAAKLSGSRFVVLKGGLARMERALGQFMLDLHTTEHGYTECSRPSW
jgi:seryl-tRNA synthetase